MTDSHKFQVNLHGVIDLLSDHLYSGPQVDLGELLQNAVDAITARRMEEPTHEGEIRLELIEATDSRAAVLTVSDNGTGLNEEEIHRFLATIGESSKRGSRQDDFIGRFGIGLLSAFVVSEEIVVVTKSIKPASPTLQWRGKPDGTYTLSTINADIEPGTQVHLQAKPEQDEHFTLEKLRETAAHFGSCLPFPVKVCTRTSETSPHRPTPCLPETCSAIMLILFYPATIAPVGHASNGGLFGFGILVSAACFAWIAFAFNTNSPWTRRIIQLPLVALASYLIIHEVWAISVSVTGLRLM